MNDEINLLHSLLKNAEMGKDSLGIIIPKVEDEEFENKLKEHLEGYEKTYAYCVDCLKNLNTTVDNSNPITKGLSRATVELNSIDTSTPHLAEILIKGNHAGILDITKKVSEFSNATQDTMSYANSLLKKEEFYAKELQKFI